MKNIWGKVKQTFPLLKKESYGRNKIRFIYGSLGLRYYLSQRWQQFLGLITSTSALPSIFLGVVAISLALPDILEIVDLLILYWLGTMILLFILVIGLGRLFFLSQHPQQYAQHSIHGRGFSTSMIYISYDIWKLCAYFYYIHKGKIESLKDMTFDSDENKVKALGLSKDFSRSIAQKYKEFERIKNMIQSLSIEMDIPKVRLYEYLFQFSPTIFYNELRECAKSFNLLTSTISNKDKAILVNNLLRIFTLTKTRMGYQEDIITYRELHSNLIDITLGLGVNSSLTSYCVGLEKIAKATHKNHIIRSNSSDYSSDKISLSEIKIKMLRFLYFKRRLFPGFDLHCLLENILLKRKNDLYAREAGQLKSSIEGLSSYSNSQSMEEAEIIEGFKYTTKTVQDYIVEQREILVTAFLDYMDKDLDYYHTKIQNGQIRKIVFVTMGYSSTVNQIIYSAFASEKWKGRRDSLVNKLDCQIESKDSCEIYLYILHSKQFSLDSSFVTTRYVRYQFIEKYDILGGISKYNKERKENNQKEFRFHFKIGDDQWLRNRFDKKDECLTYIVSGAEFFQVERDNPDNINLLKCRVINSEGVSNLTRLDFKRNKTKHLIIAERYKEFDRPLINGEHNLRFKKALNKATYEHIHIYDWDYRMAIITDQGDQSSSPKYFNDNAIIAQEDLKIEATAKDYRPNKSNI